jgi:decaprenylphospho-beta-D-erythro-pentofuranosid-2-ulose 2-reductase
MRILVFGATSAIAEGTCKALLKLSPKSKTPVFYLAGRNPVKLERVNSDLRESCGAQIAGYESADLGKLEDISKIVMRAKSAMGGIDGVLIAQGSLISQELCEKDLAAFNQMVADDFVSGAVCLNTLLDNVEPRGVIAVVTSVAGDASRPGSALYCSLKSALSRYVQGLRGKFWTKKIKLIDVRPGWTTTPMTAHLKTNFLFSSPDRVGQSIAHAMVHRTPSVCYAPWWWSLIMTPFKILPNALYRYIKR